MLSVHQTAENNDFTSAFSLHSFYLPHFSISSLWEYFSIDEPITDDNTVQHQQLSSFFRLSLPLSHRLASSEVGLHLCLWALACFSVQVCLLSRGLGIKLLGVKYFNIFRLKIYMCQNPFVQKSTGDVLFVKMMHGDAIWSTQFNGFLKTARAHLLSRYTVIN